MRKHYLANHTTGPAVQISAATLDQAATTVGERVVFRGGHAITVMGEASKAAIDAFAADAQQRADNWPMQQAA